MRSTRCFCSWRSRLGEKVSHIAIALAFILTPIVWLVRSISDPPDLLRLRRSLVSSESPPDARSPAPMS